MSYGHDQEQKWPGPGDYGYSSTAAGPSRSAQSSDSLSRDVTGSAGTIITVTPTSDSIGLHYPIQPQTENETDAVKESDDETAYALLISQCDERQSDILLSLSLTDPIPGVPNHERARDLSNEFNTLRTSNDDPRMVLAKSSVDNDPESSWIGLWRNEEGGGTRARVLSTHPDVDSVVQTLPSARRKNLSEWWNKPCLTNEEQDSLFTSDEEGGSQIQMVPEDEYAPETGLYGETPVYSCPEWRLERSTTTTSADV